MGDPHPADRLKEGIEKYVRGEYPWQKRAAEDINRVRGVPTEHQLNADSRADRERAMRPAAGLTADERAVFHAVQRDRYGKTNADIDHEHLEKGAAYVYTKLDEGIAKFEKAHPIAGKPLEKVLDALDFKAAGTILDPERAAQASNFQGVMACLSVAATIVPADKVEEFVGKGARKLEGKAAELAERALEREAREHPAQFAHTLQKVSEWANEALPDGAKEKFDKVLDKIKDYAKKHGVPDVHHAAAPADPVLAKIARYDGKLHTGKVVYSDGETAVQNIGGGKYMSYAVPGDIGRHAPLAGEILRMGNGVAKPLEPKLAEAVREANARGCAVPAPAPGALKMADQVAAYVPGTMVRVDHDTYALHQGRGGYVVFDLQRDLHGHVPPVDQKVTVDRAGHVAPAHDPAHPLGHPAGR